MKSRGKLVLAGIVVLALAAACAFVFSRPKGVNADEIVARCASEGDHQKCYETEIPKLYGAYSIPQIFDLIREVRAKDPSYQFCHVLAHKLGEEVVAADPSKWLDAIALNPSDNICSNGFIHGVIVGRYRDDVLDSAHLQAALPDLKMACEPHGDWHPSPLDQAICYHGMGHLFTFVTNADLRRALDACNAIGETPTGNFLRVCREGVFMQIYQPLEPDDFALINLLPEKPSIDNYRRMCGVYSNTPEEKGACLREAWPLLREGVTTGTGVTTFCSQQPNANETDNCYQTAAAIVGRMSLNNQAKAAAACLHFPSARQTECFSTTAQALLEEEQTNGEKAIALCNAAPTNIASQCVETLARRASFIFPRGSSGHDQFCNLLPESDQKICNGS